MTQTIGQRLKAEREAQKLTLEKVFEITRIRVPYLHALETDDLSSVPSPVQARGYLRNYAEYLGLDFKELLDEMRANMQGTSGEVIGPADDAPINGGPVPSQDNTTRSAQPVPQAPETLDLAQRMADLVREATPLASPPLKPVRRKKASSQPEATAAHPAPKRRGRKNNQAEPEPNPVVKVAPLEVDEQKPETVEEPIAQVEVVPQAEPLTEDVEAVAQEAVTQTDVSDTLWQKWLNRVGSVLSARMKRRTLVQREPTHSEIDREVSLAEPDVILAKDVDQATADTRNFPLEKSSAIFKEIGLQLRERRELLSLHLDEVERNTHVKAHYLAALEKGA